MRFIIRRGWPARSLIRSPRPSRYYWPVAYEFNPNDMVYALWCIVPFAKVWYWWMNWRCVVEIALRHRLFDVPDGHSCLEWTLRPVSRWSWRRVHKSDQRSTDPRWKRGTGGHWFQTANRYQSPKSWSSSHPLDVA